MLKSIWKNILFPVVSQHFSCYTVYKNHRILTGKQIVTVHCFLLEVMFFL